MIFAAHIGLAGSVVDHHAPLGRQNGDARPLLMRGRLRTAT
jgi:hypothetical protein